MKDRNGKKITRGCHVYYEAEQVILKVVSYTSPDVDYPTLTGDDGGTLYRWVDPRQCELVHRS